MLGPKRSQQVTKSKVGLNYVRMIVENAGSIFTKIDQEDDLGIDGIVELMVDGAPAHVNLALQIKSGDSYYDSGSEECLFPVGNHREYWLKHPLPVIGIVQVPKKRSAFWLNLKSALKDQGQASILRFKPLRFQIFSEESFSQIFVPLAVRRPLGLSKEALVSLATSKIYQERSFGFQHLFKNFGRDRQFWNLVLDQLRQSEFTELDGALPYHLAHIPWHGDLGAGGHPVEGELKKALLKELAALRTSEIVKLLMFIHPEDGIARGTLGQSVEAVISAVDDFPEKLSAIVGDSSLPLPLREQAVIIHAMYRGKVSLPLLEELVRSGSGYAADLHQYLQAAGHLNPYS